MPFPLHGSSSMIALNHGGKGAYYEIQNVEVNSVDSLQSVTPERQLILSILQIFCLLTQNEN